MSILQPFMFLGTIKKKVNHSDDQNHLKNSKDENYCWRDREGLEKS